MNRLMRYVGTGSTALAATAIAWVVVELVTLNNRWALFYALAYLLLIGMNLAPLSGVLVARALPGLSPRRRLAFFLSWALPSLAVFAIDAFVIAIAMSGPG